MIARELSSQLETALNQGKAIILTGPRQVGKTTLIRWIVERINGSKLWLTGDDPAARAALENISLSALKELIGSHEIVVIDEAQRLVNASLTLKLITDHLPEVQLLVTGSSSLDIAAQTKESLVGRKFDFTLLPLSRAEMSQHFGEFHEKSALEQRMIFGAYPDVIKAGQKEAERILYDLSDGLMYKDLLALDQIKKPSLIVKLLQAMALRLGQEVSYHEIAQLVLADPVTVERYINLLEQSFVVFRLKSLSRNARNEIKKGRKVYFWDNGIRNAIIRNFNPLSLRNDVGALWENYVIVERYKRNLYRGYFPNIYFWRTTTQQEIDYVEEYGGRMSAFEIKWNPKSKVRFPKNFKDAYPNSKTKLIHHDNLSEILSQKR
ncbi:MAG: ATP-binding protein [Bacteroidota bacterium]